MPVINTVILSRSEESTAIAPILKDRSGAMAVDSSASESSNYKSVQGVGLHAPLRGVTIFAVISRSDQKFKKPLPTPSRGQVIRDKLWGIAPKFISYLSVPRLGAGLGVGKVIN